MKIAFFMFQVKKNHAFFSAVFYENNNIDGIAGIVNCPFHGFWRDYFYERLIIYAGY
jgi:hypothetical protein